MSKTLTITLSNIPDDALAEIWKDAIKEARRGLGIPIEPTDSIVIDFGVIAEDYPDNREILPELVGSAISGHVLMTADKILNQ